MRVPQAPAPIAVSLIVTDASDTVERCLASVRSSVDAIYVLDTGSSDGTLELPADLARRPGAPIHVEHGEWEDDFARARNRAMSMVPESFEWLLALDADEIVHGSKNLRRLLAELPANADSLLGFEEYVTDGHGNALSIGIFQLVVRLSAGVRWEGILHATLEPIREGRWSLAPADVFRIEHLCSAERFLSHDHLQSWRRLFLKERLRGDGTGTLLQLSRRSSCSSTSLRARASTSWTFSTIRRAQRTSEDAPRWPLR